MHSSKVGESFLHHVCLYMLPPFRSCVSCNCSISCNVNLSRRTFIQFINATLYIESGRGRCEGRWTDMKIISLQSNQVDWLKMLPMKNMKDLTFDQSKILKSKYFYPQKLNLNFDLIWLVLKTNIILLNVDCSLSKL